MSDTENLTPEQRERKRKRDSEDKRQKPVRKQTYKPKWFIDIDYNFNLLVRDLEQRGKKHITINELEEIFHELMKVGRDAELEERPERYLNTATKDDVEELKNMVLASNPSYAAKLKIQKKLRDPIRPTLPEKPKFTFSLKLHVDDDRTKNEKLAREILIKCVQPAKNKIRMSCWMSRNSGNMVADFPTAEERDKAKELLTPKYGNKILEKKQRKIPLWIRNAECLEDCSVEDLQSAFSAMNGELWPSDGEVKWIGREGRKRLLLRAPASTATKILTTGYLYSEGYRHPVQVLPPLPFRCGKCLTFHNCRSENFTRATACRFCGAPHSSQECHLKDTPEKHSCTTCRHYQWKERPTECRPHDAMSKDCPAWKAEMKLEESRICETLAAVGTDHILSRVMRSHTDLTGL